MAFSATKVREDLLGTSRIQHYDISFASVTEGAVVTGFAQVFAAHYQNSSADTTVRVFKNNSDASTADLGSVFINGATSNDIGVLTVFGL